ncbi:MAG: protein kinase [Rikenellaceae bacterium]
MEVFLEDYTFLEELGKGSYATVYKVRHNTLGYIRAVRVLNAVIAQGEQDRVYMNFLDECRLLLRLGNGNHSNIVHIYQPLLKSQCAIVEMDYVDGRDLYHYLEDESSFVDVVDVIKLVTDIGSALAYCHEDIYKFCMDRDLDNLKDDPNDGTKIFLDDKTRSRLIEKYRVIHNDIHSGNIIRKEDGSYVLLDFGLAIEGDTVVRSSRRKNGAPEFKAPEKWDNDGLLTTQSDIYSFGVVLYEFLAGRVPFPFDKKLSNNIEAEYLLGEAHKREKPMPIYELRKEAFEQRHPGETYKKDYPDWLEALIMKCLEKEPESRYTNGRELFDEVKRSLSRGVALEMVALKEENETLQKRLSDVKTGLNLENDAKTADYQQRLKSLEAENESLVKESRVHRNSGEYITLQQKEIESLKEDLRRVQRENNIKTIELSTIKVKRDNLLDEVDSLKSQKKSSSGVVWKVLASIFFVLSVILLIRGGGSSESVEEPALIEKIGGLESENLTLEQKVKRALEEKAQLQTKYDNAVNGSSSKSSDEVKGLKAKIEQLESQNKSMTSKSVVNERDKTIEGLRSEITKKDRLINALNEQIGVR